MAYSCLNFQRAPEGMSSESYIWDLGEAQRGQVTREGEGAGQRPANALGEVEAAGPALGSQALEEASGSSFPCPGSGAVKRSHSRSRSSLHFRILNQGIRNQTPGSPTLGPQRAYQRVPSRLRRDPGGGKGPPSRLSLIPGR